MRAWILATGAAGVLVTAAAILPAASEEGEAAERKKLEGTWQGYVVNGRGERTDRGVAKLTELVITGDTIRARDDKLSFGTGTYKLNLDSNPRHLDPTGTEGQVKGLAFTGIYTLEGDTLKWCVANPRKPRPTEYRTQAAVQFYMVLKRKPADNQR